MNDEGMAYRELPAPAVETAPAQLGSDRPGRMHLVVVVTRGVRPADKAPPGTTLVTRFWHPRDHKWNENIFDSLDHALRLFVDESGWVLRQQQALDTPEAHELIFEARREDFSRPSTEQILHEVGLSPEEVANLLERVDRDGEGK
ncbi:MAG: hypothetical protein H0X07_00920 [Gemmatimonadales bacterium]|nr:hypothetical protein [Gemmatimonadales bacterium]